MSALARAPGFWLNWVGEMQQAIVFFFLLATIFGPKVGLVDVSIVLGLAFAVVLGAINVRFDRTLLPGLAILAVYCAYVLIAQLFLGIPSTDVVLRSLRALAMMLVFLLASGFLVHHGRSLVPALLAALLTHAILVVLASQYDGLNEFLGNAYGNDRVRPFRSSGLSAGFDVGGFFCLVGLLALVTGVVRVRRAFLSAVLALAFLLGCYFTSRVSAILGLIVYAGLGAIPLWGRSFRLWDRMLAVPLAVGVVALFAYQVAQFLEVAFSWGIIPVDADSEQSIVERFSSATVEEAGLLGMYFVPQTYAQVLFGAGTDAVESDVGYVRFLFWHGIAGLALVLALHLFLANRALCALARARTGRGERAFVCAVYVLVFVLTFKNNYLLTRGVWTLLLWVHVYASWRALPSRRRDLHDAVASGSLPIAPGS